MNFSRDASGDAFKLADTKDIINETLEFCQARFNRYGVNLILSLADTPIPINGRTIQISQVLINLLNNAFDVVQGTDDPWIKIEAQTLAEVVEIKVIDSGVKITADKCAKIFQPFFTTKEVGKGTGLGLSISSGIIEVHRGTVA